ncbi:hypothetical protein FB45DRAFT_1022570 [Roridomyces roridus]|uniref:glutathione transferase n=1 Tax=Roridomyces roridus TaxID=1738132 RepID=A0AAD7C8B6_9AGAR|nr:hypothetical protein FB45DRAFT_1022570 [Roridomyces roridus]
MTSSSGQVSGPWGWADLECKAKPGSTGTESTWILSWNHSAGTVTVELGPETLRPKDSRAAAGTAIVALVIAETQIPFDLPTNQNKTPQDDDDFVLYESRAICGYLCDKYPEQGTKGLYPTGLEERALVEQTAYVESTDFIRYVRRILRELYVKP